MAGAEEPEAVPAELSDNAPLVQTAVPEADESQPHPVEIPPCWNRTSSCVVHGFPAYTRLGHFFCNKCLKEESGSLIFINTAQPLRRWNRGFWYDMGQVRLPLSANSADYPRLALIDARYQSLDFGPRRDGQFRVALENVPPGLFKISLKIRTTAISIHDGKRRKVAASLWKKIGRIEFMIGALGDPGAYLNQGDRNPVREWSSNSCTHKIVPGKSSETVELGSHNVMEGNGVGIYIAHDWAAVDLLKNSWQLDSIIFNEYSKPNLAADLAAFETQKPIVPNMLTILPPPLRTHKDYQIGIICALAHEKAAVEAMLDEEHPKLARKEQDANDYTLGRMGVHNVTIACLPASKTGTESAAIVAKDMGRSFPIKFGLMVGVGGGVWSKKVDLHLGDVVVSQPEGVHSGVVQYNFGKKEKGGEFRRTGSLDKPPPVLLHALQSMKTKHFTDGDKLQESLLTMTRKKPYMAETFSYRGAEKDQLFEAAYDHVGGETCDKCDKSKVVARPDRKDSAPKIYYGNIASGNEVIKHGVTRDQIARNEFICFEMEAAGLMDHFPCLVIRGICDYADSHKNKTWQPYAAATAAAFARELLSFVDKQEVVHSVKELNETP